MLNSKLKGPVTILDILKENCSFKKTIIYWRIIVDTFLKTKQGYFNKELKTREYLDYLQSKLFKLTKNILLNSKLKGPVTILDILKENCSFKKTIIYWRIIVDTFLKTKQGYFNKDKERIVFKKKCLSLSTWI